MFWLKLLGNLIKVLRAGDSPPLIAAGLTMGFVVGLTPALTLQSLLLLLVAVLTKVNLSAFFFGLFLFSFCAFLFDPWFHHLGFVLLNNVGALEGLWTALYNAPLAPFTRFYNTVVAGSLTMALLLAAPVYLLTVRGVVLYRERWEQRILNWRLVRYIRGLTIYEWYQRLDSLR